MAYLQSIDGLHGTDRVAVRCDVCGAERQTLFISAKRNLRRNGKHYCPSCRAKARPLPQTTKDYWTEDRRRAHGDRVRSSDAYYESLKTRDTSGPRNGMFGRQHTEETRKKMSVSRTGKLGPNATAWKGGKRSITARVKKIIHTRYGWYAAVLRRDGWKCVECGSKKQIEPHHIDPVVKIIKRLTAGETFDSDEAKVEWLVSRPEIKDSKLKNGITLCRPCHKQAHNNWGSHTNP